MKNRFLVAAVLVLAVGACSDSEDPGEETYVTNLDGAQERPNPVTTTASGTGSLTVNANRTITYSLAQTGMTPTVQHIHGPAGAEGSAGVIVAVTIGQNQTLTPANFTGAVSYDSLLVLLRNNMTYFNIHSTAFPAGEIRGNLRRP